VIETYLIILLAGLSAGIAHVYLGVDHLAALLPLSHGKPRASFWLGAKWGMGHSLGVIIVALVFIGLRETAELIIDVEQLSVVAERLVGVVLIGLGITGFRAAHAEQLHTHLHTHEGKPHIHLHMHAEDRGHDALDPSFQHPAHTLHGHAAFFAGVVQGVAGMSFLWGVLPALALTLKEAGVYLAGFALASIVAMAVFAGGLGLISDRFGRLRPELVMYPRYGAAGTCCLVGMWWLVS